MPPNRPRYDDLGDGQEQEQEVEHTTSVKVTWIANHLYQSWSNVMPLVYLTIYPAEADLHMGLNKKRDRNATV